MNYSILAWFVLSGVSLLFALIFGFSEGWRSKDTITCFFITVITLLLGVLQFILGVNHVS